MSDKAIGTIIGIIIGAALLFWVFNNPSGIGDGADAGATKVNTKVSTFDYSGSVAPGVGHTLP
ncbi:hypothetical protein GZH47_31530 (plasmid) [Paenibacillus rhizovicinus]|jgi:hypothetical protein|uniref:Uncharacterized protein n=1 Tax=Paenibacillus rhizovicinus TaxID=2704463 RepID=A0A6C0PCV6_9BACL|nr:hypothetical protein [Paenibacillus rhizovicinus]QHW35432.1 hypothetical protein GZH47_31530 [Paenibacillus rhizovicinus]